MVPGDPAVEGVDGNSGVIEFGGLGGGCRVMSDPPEQWLDIDSSYD